MISNILDNIRYDKILSSSRYTFRQSKIVYFLNSNFYIHFHIHILICQTERTNWLFEILAPNLDIESQNSTAVIAIYSW